MSIPQLVLSLQADVEFQMTAENGCGFYHWQFLRHFFRSDLFFFLFILFLDGGVFATSFALFYRHMYQYINIFFHFWYFFSFSSFFPQAYFFLFHFFFFSHIFFLQINSKYVKNREFYIFCQEIYNQTTVCRSGKPLRMNVSDWN